MAPRRKTEKIFQREFVNSIKEQLRCFVENHYDYPIQTEGRKIPVYKPFDLYFLHEGTYYACELKAHTSRGAWPFSAVKPHQVSKLLSVVKNGGKAFIIIKVSVPKDLDVPDSKALNFVYYFSIEDYLSVVEISDRKSFRFNALQHASIVQNSYNTLPRKKLAKGYGWDVSALIGPRVLVIEDK